MPLPAGFQLEEQPQVQLPEGFKLEEPVQNGMNLPAGFQLESEPQEGGILDYAASALKQRVQSFVPAAKLYFGVGDEEQATKDLANIQQEADSAYKETHFSEIGDEYRKGNYGAALGKTLDKFKEVAGSSFGTMAPAIAAGAVATATAPATLPAAAVGTAAFGLTALGSYIADNIGRQKQEHPDQPVNRVSSTVAAAGQTALDLMGFKVFKPLGALVGLEGEGLADKATKEVVEAATDPKAYRKAVAKGIAEGIAFEVPQEVAQQVLERWQADLPLNPFTDPSAAQEYLDAAGGALMLGPAFGTFSTVMETRAARQQAAQQQQQQQQQELNQFVTPPQPAQTTLAPETPSEVAGDVKAVADTLEKTANHTPEDAQTIASRIVADANATPEALPEVAPEELDSELISHHEEQITAQNKEAGWGLTPAEIRASAIELAKKEVQDTKSRVDQRAQDHIDAGVEPEAARKTAAEQIKEEDHADHIAEQEHPAVGSEADRTGVPVAEQPGAVAAPTGVGEPESKPVAPAEQTAAGPTTGEAVQPSALTEGQTNEPTAEGVTEPAVQPAVAEQVETPPTPSVAEEVEKRGRKPLSAEERAAREAERKANRSKYQAAERQFSQNKDNVLSQLEEANKPLDEGEFENEEALAQAQEDQRAQKAHAINQMLDIEETHRGTALGKRVKAILNDRTKVSQEELDKVKRSREIRRKTDLNDLRGVSQKGASILAQRTSTGTADAGFSNAKNGAQALTRVLKTGDAFQKLLAARLRPFVNGVKFVVIEKGDALPAELQKPHNTEAWENARGVYVQNDQAKTKVVYVRGASFGDDQGVNNVTVLHELLHAATNQKIELSMRLSNQGEYRNSKLVKFVEEIYDLAHYAHQVYDHAVKNRIALPAGVRQVVESSGREIFTDPKEFVAYGMSDPAFQEFLKHLQGRYESGFSRFVRAILNLFGLGKDKFTALSDLVHLTDKVLSTRKTAIMRLMEKGMPSEEEISANAKKTEKKQYVELAKLEKSNAADALKEGGTLEKLTKLRSGEQLADELAPRIKAFKQSALRELLPSLLTDTLASMAERLNLHGVSSAWSKINDMEAWRSRRVKVMGEIATRLGDMRSNNAEMYRKLANTMHYSTLMEVDPTTKHTNAALTRMWNGLTPEAKKLYTDVRDFYRDNYELYYASLEDQINRMGLPAADKEKILAGIKQMYEDGKRIQPYFPLMRYGQYWARIGKGAKSEFHMFESLSDREVFLHKHAKTVGSTVDQLMEDQDIDVGNNLSSAKTGESSKMLKDIFASINEAMRPITDDYGNVVSHNVEAEKIKDEIYQMFLQSLPERSFRKKFIHRQGKIGFSTDIHRNFVTTSASMTNQVARTKYSHGILNDIDSAQSSLAGNPDKSNLSEIVNEMRMRAERELYPPIEQDTATEAASRFFTTSAFLWMMSSVKTAVAQFSAIPVFVAPVLASRHGLTPTAAAMGRYLGVFNGFSVKDANGKWTPPTIGNSKGLTENQKKAVQYMKDRGISDITMAYDIAGRKSMSTTAYQSTTRKVVRNVTGTMTALFHNAERMIREVAFMSSYDLYANKKKADGTNAHTHEEALALAEKETHYALNNYHTGNRPRGIGQDASGKVRLSANAPLGRAALQFKMFPAFVTTYFVRNGYRMFKDLDPQSRSEARKQFLGSMGMSLAIAGTMGVPGFSFAMGVIQGILHALEGDDDDDPEKRDLEMWFRNKWLPETFGGIKVGGHSLDEILDRGVITAMTGYDITSSLSLNNMWFPDVKESATAQAQMQDYLMSIAGPGATLAFKQFPSAIDYFHQGQIVRGMEQLMPAMARAPLTAYRYSKEGAQTAAGHTIKDADEFTTGQLIGQSFGFSTEGLQARREAIFKIEGQIIKAKQEKAATLTRFEREITSGSESGVEQAMDKIMSYNARNWNDPIEGSSITEALQRRMKQRFDRGIQIDKKYYPFYMSLLEPSSNKLEREAAK